MNKNINININIMDDNNTKNKYKNIVYSCNKISEETLKNAHEIKSVTIFENHCEGLELLKNVEKITIIKRNINKVNKKIEKKINGQVYIVFENEIFFVGGFMQLITLGA